MRRMMVLSRSIRLSQSTQRLLYSILQQGHTICYISTRPPQYLLYYISISTALAAFWEWVYLEYICFCFLA
jgi:archaellum biogenesis ATPase FlaH